MYDVLLTVAAWLSSEQPDQEPLPQNVYWCIGTLNELCACQDGEFIAVKICAYGDIERKDVNSGEEVKL